MKINNCFCGRKAKTIVVGVDGNICWVVCTRTDDGGDTICWSGPDRKTEREAIKAWNKIMEDKNGKRN